MATNNNNTGGKKRSNSSAIQALFGILRYNPI